MYEWRPLRARSHNFQNAPLFQRGVEIAKSQPSLPNCASDGTTASRTRSPAALPSSLLTKCPSSSSTTIDQAPPRSPRADAGSERTTDPLENSSSDSVEPTSIFRNRGEFLI